MCANTEHKHHRDDLNESISNIEWALRSVLRAESIWRLQFLSEIFAYCKSEREEWTQDESDMQRLRDTWAAKHKRLKARK